MDTSDLDNGLKDHIVAARGAQPIRTTLSLGTISRTAGVPGGITDLLVLVYDETHTVTGYADCYQTDSSCQTGQF